MILLSLLFFRPKVLPNPEGGLSKKPPLSKMSFHLSKCFFSFFSYRYKIIFLTHHRGDDDDGDPKTAGSKSNGKKKREFHFMQIRFEAVTTIGIKSVEKKWLISFWFAAQQHQCAVYPVLTVTTYIHYFLVHKIRGAIVSAVDSFNCNRVRGRKKERSINFFCPAYSCFALLFFLDRS